MDGLVLVSGLPRSGTSLLMQMLHAGGFPVLADDVRQADEDNPRGYFEFAPVKRSLQDVSWLERGRGRAVKVVAQLLPTLPANYSYRILFIHRDLNEVVASQRRMLDRLGRTGAKLSSDELIALYQKQLTRVERWIAEKPNATCLTVRHREVILNPTQAACAINDFLNGGLDVDAMAKVVDARLYRQQASNEGGLPAE